MAANAILEIIIPIDVSHSLVIKKLHKIGVEVVVLNDIKIQTSEESKPNNENFADQLRSISMGVKNYQHQKSIDGWYATWSEKYLGKIKEKAIDSAHRGFTEVKIDIPADFPFQIYLEAEIEDLYKEKVETELEKTLGVKVEVSCTCSTKLIYGALPEYLIHIILSW